MSTNTKRGAYWLVAICLILAVPLVAMQFTQEVNWSFGDFVVLGVLLACAGLFYELIIRSFKSSTKRIALTFVLITTFIVIWLELAVGIFNTLFAGT